MCEPLPFVAAMLTTENTNRSILKIFIFALIGVGTSRDSPAADAKLMFEWNETRNEVRVDENAAYGEHYETNACCNKLS